VRACRRLYEKYGGRMAKLLQFFDSDHDGQISKEDFLDGVKKYHWPLTHDEAVLIFAGIDGECWC
jgi:Ca2+-binding EF-hand superfamily protein